MKETRSSFLEKIADEEMKRVVGSRIEQLSKMDSKEKRKRDLASITREIAECTYVSIDEDCELTIGDMMVATAAGNSIGNKRTTFKDVNEMAKAVEGVTSSDTSVSIVIKGQDLGD